MLSIRRMLGLALLLAVLSLGTGCSGVNASGSVSPAMFFLPGLGQTTPHRPLSADSPAAPAQDALPAARSI